MLKPLPDKKDWNFEDLEHIIQLIDPIAKDLGLEAYPKQIEVITANQMLSAYSTVGLPLGYHHWSYGKDFIRNQADYNKGAMGLAYEIVINSNPCISYLMQDNSLMMQTLVLAHAAIGHSSFFKNNYLFKEWTDAEGIIDYMLFAKNYITECEQKYGVHAVEKLLDSCHALQSHGVDRYKRPAKLSMAEEKFRQKEREAYIQSQVNDLWRTIPKKEAVAKMEGILDEPQENLLYFIEKNAPLLEPWQREIIRITRKIAQYFYPQRQTQVSNEGFASWSHYSILNEMYDRNLVGDGFMLEFLESHTGVVTQRAKTSINPYALGFAMYQDIRRICQNPTKEDRHWFPELIGKNWNESILEAAYNFKDESFILQYLSPKVIRDFHFFSVLDDDNQDMLKISAIHDDDGYQLIRQKLSAQYNVSNMDPYICVSGVDKYDRSLTLTHTPHNRHSLHSGIQGVLRHIAHLWGFEVKLYTHDEDGDVVWRAT